MLSVLLSALAVAGQVTAGSTSGPEIVHLGWHDEFRTIAGWHPLKIENKATACLPNGGDLRLSLNHVPDKWPYTYQWSGLMRNIRADISRYPVLIGYVTHVHGYAHLDIDVLDARGRVVKTVRSTTASAPTPGRQMPGFVSPALYEGEIESAVVSADLGDQLQPGSYNLQVRLIVGGSNSGCSAEYHWLRFTSRKDAGLLTAYPNTAVRS